ncbi:hypothetical protein Q5H93_21005 [Hymenobacter sp. ASUV-10]|uniref:DUF4231 domain-containing protein n=1 Tax=Hymenobacter aranciens TaxID=3063996 RepID=A0ABT9BHT9_9BACT|nr:hypothetical protein [Hymenobacter sp. ASUV-10]MDO7877238.1 hypothetical protein [Hymenobacter sp. ASUV-10]
MLFSFRLLCLALLLAATSRAMAQTTPAPLPPARTLGYENMTRADTARAVRRLFKSRRGGGVGWLALGTAGVAGSTLPALQSTSAGVWTPGVVISSGFLLIGLNKTIQFRRGRERRVLRELAATGHLRPSVLRRLRGKFEVVKGAASDYNPLLAEGIAPPPVLAALSPEQRQEKARADTLRAITRLFERHQRNGKAWAYAGGTGGTLALARLALGTSTANSRPVTAGGLAVGAGVGIVLPLAISLYHFTAYSEEKQDEAERNYRAGQPLPKAIRRHLRKKDLQPYD